MYSIFQILGIWATFSRLIPSEGRARIQLLEYSFFFFFCFSVLCFVNLLDFVQQKSPPYKWYSVYGPAEDDHTVPPVIDGAIWVEEDITYYSTLHSSLLRGSSLSPFVDQVLDQVLLVMVMVFNSVLSYPRLSIVYMSLVTGRDSYNAG